MNNIKNNERDCDTCKHYVDFKIRNSGETTKACDCWECKYEKKDSE